MTSEQCLLINGVQNWYKITDCVSGIESCFSTGVNQGCRNFTNWALACNSARATMGQCASYNRASSTCASPGWTTQAWPNCFCWGTPTNSLSDCPASAVSGITYNSTLHLCQCTSDLACYNFYKYRGITDTQIMSSKGVWCVDSGCQDGISYPKQQCLSAGNYGF
jgi:hypothetical protein